MKNIFKYILLGGFVLVLVFLLVSDSKKAKKVNNTENKIELYNYTSEITIKDASLNVEIARTAEAQARGLSGRESLKEDQGMLFDFETSDIYKFWMKDMKFPIDMIWFDEDRRVVYIQEDATPESYPESFGPNENTKYVLEVVSGFTKKYNIQIGDEMVFQFPD